MVILHGQLQNFSQVKLGITSQIFSRGKNKLQTKSLSISTCALKLPLSRVPLRSLQIALYGTPRNGQKCMGNQGYFNPVSGGTIPLLITGASLKTQEVSLENQSWMWVFISSSPPPKKTPQKQKCVLFLGTYTMNLQKHEDVRHLKTLFIYHKTSKNVGLGSPWQFITLGCANPNPAAKVQIECYRCCVP